MFRRLSAQESYCETFRVFTGQKHTEQDPLPDQVRVMWLCLKEDFFTHKPGCLNPKIYTTEGISPKNVSNMFINVYQKGQKGEGQLQQEIV